MTVDPQSRASRIAVLESCGAAESQLEELLAYTDRVLCPPNATPTDTMLLEDEPHLAVWREYARDAAGMGVFEALASRFVQLRFPVQAGIRETEAYRAATQRGEFSAARAFSAPRLERPEELLLTLERSMAGTIPVLTAATRADFEWLVSAFTARNEPGTVPKSMGACIVSGLINWDRVARHRAAWESTRPKDDDAASWPDELARLARQKELYQDRFVILSRGPYSGVAARDIGMDENVWLDRSLDIRRDHELTHYFTQRRFGSMQNHVLDEIVADFVGLIRALGEYRADLAALFLGLDSRPELGEAGRIELYRGTPPLSEDALSVVRELTRRAIQNLAGLARRHASLLREQRDLAEVVAVIGGERLEGLAASGMPERIGVRLAGRRGGSSRTEFNL